MIAGEGESGCDARLEDGSREGFAPVVLADIEEGGLVADPGGERACASRGRDTPRGDGCGRGTRRRTRRWAGASRGHRARGREPPRDARCPPRASPRDRHRSAGGPCASGRACRAATIRAPRRPTTRASAPRASDACGGGTRAATRPTARRARARRVHEVSWKGGHPERETSQTSGGRCPTDRRVSFGFFSKERALSSAPRHPPARTWTHTSVLRPVAMDLLSHRGPDEEADDARPGMTPGTRAAVDDLAFTLERIALKTPGPDRLASAATPPRRSPRLAPPSDDAPALPPDGVLTALLAKAAASPLPTSPNPPRARASPEARSARRAIQARERHSRRLPRGESAPERRGERPRAGEEPSSSRVAAAVSNVLVHVDGTELRD